MVNGNNCFGINKNSMMMCGEPNQSKNIRIIIDDSREGWCDSVKILLESYMIPGHPTVSFDYSLVRICYMNVMETKHLINYF
jgi:hypothetical protein